MPFKKHNAISSMAFKFLIFLLISVTVNVILCFRAFVYLCVCTMAL